MPTPIVAVTPTEKPDITQTITPTVTQTIAPTTSIIETPQHFIKGDANLDGSITGTDMLIIKKHLVEIEILDKSNLENADANGDGEITTTDLLTLKRYIVGIITEI